MRAAETTHAWQVTTKKRAPLAKNAEVLRGAAVARVRAGTMLLQSPKEIGFIRRLFSADPIIPMMQDLVGERARRQSRTGFTEPQDAVENLRRTETGLPVGPGHRCCWRIRSAALPA